MMMNNETAEGVVNEVNDPLVSVSRRNFKTNEKWCWIRTLLRTVMLRMVPVD
jgi:hypothetical protein